MPTGIRRGFESAFGKAESSCDLPADQVDFRLWREGFNALDPPNDGT